MSLLSLVIGTAVVGISLLLGIGSRLMFRTLKDDNPIEEICEEIIEDQTSISFDFTPDTPEEGKISIEEMPICEECELDKNKGKKDANNS